jgi:hypothetical protein
MFSSTRIPNIRLLSSDFEAYASVHVSEQYAYTRLCAWLREIVCELVSVGFLRVSVCSGEDITGIRSIY